MAAYNPRTARAGVVALETATPEVREALADLLSVTEVSQVTPQRVQQWQVAARAVIGGAGEPVTPAVPSDDTPGAE